MFARIMQCYVSSLHNRLGHLLGSLVNLFQKADKHLLLQPRLGLIHLLNHLDDPVVRLLFVLGESARDVNV